MRSLIHGLLFPLLSLFSALYLGFCCFTAPARPILLGGDQVFFWSYAQRMLAGERIYRDFFQFTPPGTDLVYLAAFALGGPRVWVTNAVVIATGVALGSVCFVSASQIADRAAAAVAAAFFVVFVYGKALNATHHWFSVLGIMSCVAVLSPRRTRPRLFGAGALLGAASFFTQTHGAVALLAVAIFLSLEGRREQASWRVLVERYIALSSGFALALCAAYSYFLFRGDMQRMWSLQVTYASQHIAHYPLWPCFGLGETPTWHRLPWLAPYLCIYLLLPAAYATVLIHCWRRGADIDATNWSALLLPCLVGILLLAEVASNLSWLRLFAVAMPGVVLSAAVISRAGALRRFLLIAVGLATAALGFIHVRSMHRNYSIAVDLPAGQVLTDMEHAEKLRWLARHTSRGDLFFFATWPSYYFLLDLRNPVYLDVIDASEQTRPEYAREAIAELEARRVRYALWSTSLEATDSSRPSLEGPALIARYVHERYRLAHRFSDGDEVLEREEARPDGVR